MFSIKKKCRMQLEVDRIDYAKLDRYVSGTLDGPAKWWVHGNFFKTVRSLNSRSTEKANREFVNGANLARGFIRDALNKEIRRAGIAKETKVRDVKFQADGPRVRITLDVDGVVHALNGALDDLGLRCSGVSLDG